MQLKLSSYGLNPNVYVISFCPRKQTHVTSLWIKLKKTFILLSSSFLRQILLCFSPPSSSSSSHPMPTVSCTSNVAYQNVNAHLYFGPLILFVITLPFSIKLLFIIIIIIIIYSTWWHGCAIWTKNQIRHGHLFFKTSLFY